MFLFYYYFWDKSKLIYNHLTKSYENKNQPFRIVCVLLFPIFWSGKPAQT
ncbi:protein of unknown function [Chryseobacterium sp. JV274]|nr:protein of unknown function [Chryseobacterium sp. JV274]